MTALRLKRAATALVGVDMQERLLPAIHDNVRVVANTRLLLRTARVLELPVFFFHGVGDLPLLEASGTPAFKTLLPHFK